MVLSLKSTLLAALAVATTVLVATPALADRDDHHWRGDIHRFHDRDFHRWRGGHWYHGYHGDRLGWWWIAAGTWYFYPQPVYPYPYPYYPYAYTPPVVVQPAPPAVTEVPPPPQSWYYCESAHAYYPYVAECPEGWKAVPANPPSAPSR